MRETPRKATVDPRENTERSIHVVESEKAIRDRRERAEGGDVGGGERESEGTQRAR